MISTLHILYAGQAIGLLLTFRVPAVPGGRIAGSTSPDTTLRRSMSCVRPRPVRCWSGWPLFLWIFRARALPGIAVSLACSMASRDASGRPLFLIFRMAGRCPLNRNDSAGPVPPVRFTPWSKDLSALLRACTTGKIKFDFLKLFFILIKRAGHRLFTSSLFSGSRSG